MARRAVRDTYGFQNFPHGVTRRVRIKAGSKVPSLLDVPSEDVVEDGVPPRAPRLSTPLRTTTVDDERRAAPKSSPKVGPKTSKSGVKVRKK